MHTQEANALGDPLEIIGVVKDAKFGDMREDSAPAVYNAERQSRWVGSYYEFELRATSGEPSALIAGVKSVIVEVDRDAALEFTPLSKRDSFELEPVGPNYTLLAVSLSSRIVPSGNQRRR